MFKENYLVDNWTSDYWKVSIYLVFFETLEHLVEERPKRVVSNEERFCFGGTSYLSPASLLSITPEIVVILFNT
jgi:hypothetical protein